MLLAAVDQSLLQYMALGADDAAVPVDINFAASIENILRVLPDTTNIAVVIGTSPHEKEYLELMRTAFQPFTDRATFTWFNEISFNDMMERASKLPPHSAIFWRALIVNADGVSHPDFDALTIPSRCR
jgi:hypothetical protein